MAPGSPSVTLNTYRHAHMQDGSWAFCTVLANHLRRGCWVHVQPSGPQKLVLQTLDRKIVKSRYFSKCLQSRGEGLLRKARRDRERKRGGGGDEERKGEGSGEGRGEK